jgi:hypothetical protein
MPTLELMFRMDAEPLTRFLSDFAASLGQGTSNVHVRNGLQESQGEYFHAMRDRFVAQSSGGGEWRELAPITQRERKRLGFNPARPILIRLAILITALRPGAPGSASEWTANSLRAGFGGSSIHPGYGDKPPSLSIGDIAKIHQEGRGRVPKRRILVEPDAQTLGNMRGPLVAAVQSIVDELSRHHGLMRKSAAA